MNRMKLVPVFAAVLLVALSGCGALNDGDAKQTTLGEPVITDDMSAEEIQQLSANATEGYSSYEMTMNMSVDSDSASLSMIMDGVVNNDEKKAKMDMTVDAGLRSFDTTAYIDDQTVYIQNENTGDWQTEQGSSSMNWEQTNQLQQQRELLNASEVEVTGSTTIDGETMTIITIQPNESAMQELVAQQQGTDFSGSSIDEMTIKMYISDQTAHVRKMDMDATMTAEGQRMEMDLIVTLSNYGTDTNIQIPDA